jgi:hypothetical protein
MRPAGFLLSSGHLRISAALRLHYATVNRKEERQMKLGIMLRTATAVLLASAAGRAYAATQDVNQPPPDTNQPAGATQQKGSSQGQADSSQAIRAYQQQATSLSEQPPDPMHAAEVKALRQLADALEAMPAAPDTHASAAAIRADADKIEKSDKMALHSDWTKDALSRAAAALDSMKASSQQPDVLSERVTTARTAIEKIDSSKPFLQQRETIDAAFMNIGEALQAAGPSGAVSAAPGAAEQQPVSGQEEMPPPVTEAPPAPVMMKPYTPPPMFQLSVGGGVADFADDASRHLTKTGGMWDVRFLAGDSTVIAGEVAYVGTANGVNNVMATFAPNGSIIGSSIEGNLRLQMPRGLLTVPVRPFGFAGIGWNHWDLVNETFRNPIAIQNSDDALLVPFGGGLQFDLGRHAAIDTRFTYRANFDENLLHTNDNGTPGVASQGLSQWAVSARLGYVF